MAGEYAPAKSRGPRPCRHALAVPAALRSCTGRLGLPFAHSIADLAARLRDDRSGLDRLCEQFVAILFDQPQAVQPHRFQVCAAQDQGHIVPAQRQPGSQHAAYSSRAYDTNFHGCCLLVI
jgi:hypothetical protein